MRSTSAILTIGAFLLFAGGEPALAGAVFHHFSGEVTHVDAAAKTLKVKEMGSKAVEMTFALARDAKIMSGSKVEALDALKPGDSIKVTYTTEGSHHRAQRIEVASAKGMSSPHMNGMSSPHKSGSGY